MTDRPQTAAEIATALRTLADKLAPLGDYALPDIAVSIDILPLGGEAAAIAAIDQIGNALYGTPGATKELSNGAHHHRARGRIAGMAVHAFTSVTAPKEREMRAELERLRAELAAATRPAMTPTT